MSFKCQVCGKAQDAGSKPNNVVIETRYVTYRNKDSEGNVKLSEGTEIVKQLKVCEKCKLRVYQIDTVESKVV